MVNPSAKFAAEPGSPPISWCSPGEFDHIGRFLKAKSTEFCRMYTTLVQWHMVACSKHSLLSFSSVSLYFTFLLSDIVACRFASNMHLQHPMGFEPTAPRRRLELASSRIKGPGHFVVVGSSAALCTMTTSTYKVMHVRLGTAFWLCRDVRRRAGREATQREGYAKTR